MGQRNGEELEAGVLLNSSGQHQIVRVRTELLRMHCHVWCIPCVLVCVPYAKQRNAIHAGSRAILKFVLRRTENASGAAAEERQKPMHNFMKLVI